MLIEKTKPGVDKKTGKTRYKSESAENINHVTGLNHHFIFVLESSLTVALSEQERKQGKFQSLTARPQTRASTSVRVFPDKAPLKVCLNPV